MGVAFDGANIWVSNKTLNTVSKLNAATGATIGTYSVGDGPWGVAFDGANIWVTTAGDDTVSKLYWGLGTAEKTIGFKE